MCTICSVALYDMEKNGFLHSKKVQKGSILLVQARIVEEIIISICFMNIRYC